MSKLHFTNDCDPDLTICELQHENEKLNKRIDEAEAWLRIASDPNHNPVFVANGITQDYFGEESQ